MGVEKIKWHDFSHVVSVLESSRVWEFDPIDDREFTDLPQAVFDAVQDPIDFPPLESAIVPGDRVAIALDSNVPAVAQVVLGVTKAIGQTKAGGIEIVLSDEATEETVDSIRDVVDSDVSVTVHHPSDREALRYLAADAAADPVYFNRNLVDADLVLPIVAVRRGNCESEIDPTGLFPTFADSASRRRATTTGNGPQTEIGDSAWQLGIHMMVTVTPGQTAFPVRIVAGTPFGAKQQQKDLNENRKGFPEPPALVVVSLDGDAQQQTWSNAARAIDTASQQVDPGGTIVLWSEIEAPPTGLLLSLADRKTITQQPAETEDGFPVWDATVPAAETIRRVATDHRLFLRSRLDREVVEGLGLGVIESNEELKRLSATFDTCGVIRAAQFGGACGQSKPRHHRPTEIR